MIWISFRPGWTHWCAAPGGDESAQREGLRFLELTLWTNTRTARIGDGKLDLHGKQFDFLYYLVENKNVIVHKERLFQRVWGFYSATVFPWWKSMPVRSGSFCGVRL